MIPAEGRWGQNLWLSPHVAGSVGGAVTHSQNPGHAASEQVILKWDTEGGKKQRKMFENPP